VNNALTLFSLGGTVSGNGTIAINNGAGVEFGQASASSQKVNFASGSTATLKLDQPSAFQSAITDFQTHGHDRPRRPDGDNGALFGRRPDAVQRDDPPTFTVLSAIPAVSEVRL
jgi:hypothetical protein